MFKRLVVLGMLVLPLLLTGVSFAAVDKPITVTASVQSSSSFSVKVYKSTSATTYDWATDLYPNMSFGMLTNAIPGNTASALTAGYHFAALVSVNNNAGATYRVQYTGAPLKHTDGSTTLSDNCFTVVGGVHYNTDGTLATTYTSGLNTTKKSAGSTSTYDVFTSNASGASDIFRVYFGITGDPTQAVSSTGTMIPPTQKAGSYSSSVKITLYP